MRQTGRERGRRTFASAILIGLLLTMFAVGSTLAPFSCAALNENNTFAAGSVQIQDNDGGQAMLGLSNAALGSTDTSCIRATSNGSLGSEVRHYADVTGTLPPYLSLKVTRGSGAGTFDSCTGFTPDSTNYFGKGAGVIYDGKLSSYPTSWAGGIVDPAAGDSYSSAVSGTANLLSYWRLGDGAISADELNDSAGTLLSNHSGAIGASWTRYSSSGTDGVFSDANRVRRNGTDFAMYYTSATPSSADYAVETDVHVKSVLSSDAVGVIGRANTSGSDTFYLARYVTGTGVWELMKVVSGTATSLGTYAQTLSAGSTYRLTLDMSGSTIRLLVNGTQRVSVTDTAITGAGRGGVRLGFGGASGVPSNTTGLHVDDFRVTSLSTTAADSKSTNNGTYAGGTRRNQPGALSVDSDRGALFESSGRVSVPDQAALDLTGSFSIEAWVKPNSVTGTQYIVNKGTRYYLYLLGSDIVFGFRGGTYKYVVASGAATSGSWQHLAGSYDGQMLRLYRNGALVASAPTSGAVETDNTALFLGAISDTGSFFSGTLDEVALYNGAVSADDVSAHYAAGAGAETWTASESHDYKFEITLDNDAAALGKSGTATFHWEARNQ